MSVIGLNRGEFSSLARQILESGNRVRFQASGGSMYPFIQNNDFLEVAPLSGKRIKCGDLLLVEAGDGRLMAHRVIKISHTEGGAIYLIKSDTCASPDGWFRVENILGRVDVVERGKRRIILSSASQQFRARVWVSVTPWSSIFSWLPARLRRYVWHWLVAD
jgi:hypothetical protein